MTTLFIGPFPPPFNGQAISTNALFPMLCGPDGRAINIGDGSSRNRFVKLANKISRHLAATLTVLFCGSTSIYISVNANQGMWLTGLLALAARLKGRRIALHHHTYSHISERRAAMAFIAKASGPAALHICICARMSDDLRATYPEIKMTSELSNVSIVQKPQLDQGSRAEDPMVVLGHLSNLTEEKGMGRAIEAFRACRQLDLASKLIVAGPCGDDFSRTSIQQAQLEFGDDFEYRGAVYGDGKEKFFRDIDVFVFPSLYENETQGIVNLESLSFGAPVVAFNLCCIATDLTENAGKAVAPSEDFPSMTAEFLTDFINNRTRFAAGARQRFEELSELNLNKVLEVKKFLSGTRTQEPG